MDFTKLFHIKLSDWWRGFVVALCTIPIGILYDWATLVGYQLNWRSVVKGFVAGGLGYLMKNFFTGENGRLLTNKVWFGVLFALLYFTSAAQAMQVEFAWDPNTETDLNGYKLYYGLTTGGPYAGTGATEGGSPIVILLTRPGFTPAAPGFLLRNLDGLKQYFFVVTATDTEGLESGYSNQVTAGPNLYILTTSVVGTGGAISPPTGPFTIATIQTVTATPNAGYRVKAWTGTNDNASKANTNTVTMTANKTVTVAFEVIPTAPAAPKNLRTVSIVAEGQTIYKFVSDPVPNAEQLKVYVVGTDWVTIPYTEITVKGQQKADLLTLDDTLGTKTIYVQALNSQGSSPIVMKKYNHSVNVYEFYDYISTVDKRMWW